MTTYEMMTKSPIKELTGSELKKFEDSERINDYRIEINRKQRIKREIITGSWIR